MSITAIGVIIVMAVALFSIGAAALSLGSRSERRLAGLAALLPASVVVGVVVALLLGYRLPVAELGVYVPVGVGLLTALLSRSLGYGLLTGLVVAATIA